MNYTLRSAVASDAEEIRILIHKVMHNSLGNSGLDLDEMLGSANRCMDYWLEYPRKSVHIVAVLNKKITGVILVKEHWNLVSLFVEPECQRQGIGKALARNAIELCRGRSPYNGVSLNAAPDSRFFYEKLGFVVREEKKDLNGVFPMQLRFNKDES